MSFIYAARVPNVGPIVKDGVGIVGGRWRSAELEVGYLQAARVLINAGPLPHTVVPIAYLQRHALELALKGLTEAALDIHSNQVALTVPPGTKLPWDVPAWDHRLPELRDGLRSALEAIERKLPKEFDDVVESFNEFETMVSPEGYTGPFPDRLRYGTVKRRDGEQFQSFPKIEHIRFQDRQNALEALFENHVYVREDMDRNKLGEDLALTDLDIAYEMQRKGIYVYVAESPKPDSGPE